MCITWAKLVGYTALHLLELSAGSKTICMWSTACVGLLPLSAQGLICAALWLTPLGSVCLGLYGWTVISWPCLCFTLWLAPFLSHQIDVSVCVCVCACGVWYMCGTWYSWWFSIGTDVRRKHQRHCLFNQRVMEKKVLFVSENLPGRYLFFPK